MWKPVQLAEIFTYGDILVNSSGFPQILIKIFLIKKQCSSGYHQTVNSCVVPIYLYKVFPSESMKFCMIIWNSIREHLSKSMSSTQVLAENVLIANWFRHPALTHMFTICPGFNLRLVPPLHVQADLSPVYAGLSLSVSTGVWSRISRVNNLLTIQGGCY